MLHAATAMPHSKVPDLVKAAGLIVFDTTPETDPDYPEDPPVPWLKYCEDTGSGLVWRKIQKVRT